MIVVRFLVILAVPLALSGCASVSQPAATTAPQAAVANSSGSPDDASSISASPSTPAPATTPGTSPAVKAAGGPCLLSEGEAAALFNDMTAAGQIVSAPAGDECAYYSVVGKYDAMGEIAFARRSYDGQSDPNAQGGPPMLGQHSFQEVCAWAEAQSQELGGPDARAVCTQNGETPVVYELENMVYDVSGYVLLEDHYWRIIMDSENQTPSQVEPTALKLMDLVVQQG